jgi:GT2 family glycosyltransferase
MAEIRFSIVITCYNQRRFIRDAVDSALALDYHRKEIIVVDDGSTDGSLEILEAYGNAITLLSLPHNTGANTARNFGAARAQGEYLVFLDGDDVLLPWALNVYEQVTGEGKPTLILGVLSSFTGAVPLQQQEVPRRIEFVRYETITGKDRTFGLSASTWVVERQAFHDVGGWSPGFFHLDLVDLGNKMRCSGRVVKLFAPHTVLYRMHAENSVNSVHPFVVNLRRMIAKEEAGEYPGGRTRRLERYAWLGGLVFHWTQRALGAGLYRDAAGLVLSGWPMVVATILRQSILRIKGRRPMEVVDFEWNPAMNASACQIAADDLAVAEAEKTTA